MSERRQAAGKLRAAFVAYTWMFRERRLEFATDISEKKRDEIRAEYRELRRQVDRAFRPLRDLFVEFLGEEPRYDLRRDVHDDGGHDVPVESPFTQWWDALTFEEALDRWANADDDHIEDLLRRQEAVLDAFENWAGTERVAGTEPAALVPPTVAPAPSPGRMQRLLNNPWMVTVGGGVIVIVIATLAVKLL